MRKKKRNLIIFGLIVLSIIFAGLYKHHLQVQKEQDFHKELNEEARIMAEEARQKIEEFEKMDLTKLSSEERRKQEEINWLHKEVLRLTEEVMRSKGKRRVDVFEKIPVAKKKTVIDLGFGSKLTRTLSNWELLSDNEVVFVKKDIYKKGYSYIFKGTIRNIGKKHQKEVYVVWAFLDPIGKDLMDPIEVLTYPKEGGVLAKRTKPLFMDVINYLDKDTEADFHISVYSYSNPYVDGSVDGITFDEMGEAIEDGRYYVGIYKAGTF